MKIKKLFIILFLIIVSSFLLSPQINRDILGKNNISFMNGIYTIKASKKPFTGILKYEEKDDEEYVEVFPLKNGYIDGKWYIKSENRILAEGDFIRGTGVFYLYYMNQKKILAKIPYKLNRQNGTEIRYYENGKKLLEKNYQNGILNGRVLQWFENGRKESASFWKDGLKDGIWKGWNKKGEIIELGCFSEGSGVLIEYYIYNCKIKRLCHYKNNKKNGISINWYPNGIKKSEVIFKNGLVDGDLKEWDENGLLKRHEIYCEGKFIRREK